MSRLHLLFNPSRLLLTSLYLALTFCTTSNLLAQEQDDPRWVSTWATSPSTLPPLDTDYEALSNQTLRLITHSSAGGSSLRIRLANYHGDQPVRIGAVSVALQSNGSSIESGSSRSISFGGKEAVTIPRGAVIISDPLAFEVPRQANLSISIYLPEDSGFLTAHSLSNQTNFISEPGNHSLAADFPVASETTAWNLLTAIDVINEQSLTAIAMVGDSITDGWGSTESSNQRWPNHFARRLFSDSSMKNYAVVNAGISGNQVTTESSPRFGQNLQARFERDVLALSNVSHMVLLEGINDIGMSSLGGAELTSADEIIAGYKNIVRRAHSRGIKVIGATLTPYRDAAYFTEAGEAVRQTVNEFIRNGGLFDGVIDFDKAVQDPSDPSHLIPSFTEDKLHPNDAGYKVMADAIDLNLFR